MAQGRDVGGWVGRLSEIDNVFVAEFIHVECRYAIPHMTSGSLRRASLQIFRI